MLMIVGMIKFKENQYLMEWIYLNWKLKSKQDLKKE